MLKSARNQSARDATGKLTPTFHYIWRCSLEHCEHWGHTIKLQFQGCIIVPFNPCHAVLVVDAASVSDVICRCFEAQLT